MAIEILTEYGEINNEFSNRKKYTFILAKW
jgi:hypothetical protein